MAFGLGNVLKGVQDAWKGVSNAAKQTSSAVKSVASQPPSVNAPQKTPIVKIQWPTTQQSSIKTPGIPKIELPKIQMTLWPQAQKPIEQMNTLEKLSFIRSLPDQDAAQQGLQLLAQEMRTPGSRHYAPYLSDASNQREAIELFGTNRFDQAFFDENRYLLNYVHQLDYTDTVSSAGMKNWSELEKRAYVYHHLLKDEQQTQQAEAEYKSLLDEMQQAFRDLKGVYGTTPTYKQLMEKVDMSKYTALQSMDKVYDDPAALYRLNRPVLYSRESTYGAYAALLNGKPLSAQNEYLTDAVQHLANGGSFDAEAEKPLQFQYAGYTDAQLGDYADQLRAAGTRKQYAEFLGSIYKSQPRVGSMPVSLFDESYYDQAFLDKYAYLGDAVKALRLPDGTLKKPTEADGWLYQMAYEYGQISDLEPLTQQVENEWSALYDDVADVVRTLRAAGVKPTAEMVNERINLSKYAAVKKLIDGQDVELNRPVYASQEALDAIVAGFVTGRLSTGSVSGALGASVYGLNQNVDYALKGWTVSGDSAADLRQLTPDELAARRADIRVNGTRRELFEFEADLYAASSRMDSLDTGSYFGGEYKDAAFFDAHADLLPVIEQMKDVNGVVRKPTEKDDLIYHMAYELYEAIERRPLTDKLEAEWDALRSQVLDTYRYDLENGDKPTFEALKRALDFDVDYPTIQKVLDDQDLKLNHPIYASKDAIDNVIYGVLLGYDVSNPEVDYALVDYKRQWDRVQQHLADVDAGRFSFVPDSYTGDAPKQSASAPQPSDADLRAASMGLGGGFEAQSAVNAADDAPISLRAMSDAELQAILDDIQAQFMALGQSRPSSDPKAALAQKEETDRLLNDRTVIESILDEREAARGAEEAENLHNYVEQQAAFTLSPTTQDAAISLTNMLLSDEVDFEGASQQQLRDYLADFSFAIVNAERKEGAFFADLADRLKAKRRELLPYLVSDQEAFREADRVEQPEYWLPDDYRYDPDALKDAPFAEVQDAYLATEFLLHTATVGLNSMFPEEDKTEQVALRDGLQKQLDEIKRIRDRAYGKATENGISFFDPDAGKELLGVIGAALNTSQPQSQTEFSRQILDKLVGVYGEDGADAAIRQYLDSGIWPTPSDDGLFSAEINELARSVTMSDGTKYQSAAALNQADPALFGTLIALVTGDQTYQSAVELNTLNQAEVREYALQSIVAFGASYLERLSDPDLTDQERYQVVAEMMIDQGAYRQGVALDPVNQSQSAASRLHGALGITQNEQEAADQVDFLDYFNASNEVSGAFGQSGAYAEAIKSAVESSVLATFGPDTPQWVVDGAVSSVGTLMASTMKTGDMLSRTPTGLMEATISAFTSLNAGNYNKILGDGDHSLDEIRQIDPFVDMLCDARDTLYGVTDLYKADTSTFGFMPNFIGSTVANMANMVVNGELGAASWYYQAYGDGMRYARDKGYGEAEAKRYGLYQAAIMGTVNFKVAQGYEAFAKYVTAHNTGALSRVVDMLTGKSALRRLFNTGLSEGAQEVSEDVFGSLNKKLTLGEDIPFIGEGGVIDTEQMSGTFVQSFFSGIITALVFGTAGNADPVAQARTEKIMGALVDGRIGPETIEAAAETAQAEQAEAGARFVPIEGGFEAATAETDASADPSVQAIETPVDAEIQREDDEVSSATIPERVHDAATQVQARELLGYKDQMDAAMQETAISGRADEIANQQIADGAANDIVGENAQPMIDLRQKQAEMEAQRQRQAELEAEIARLEQNERELVETAIGSGIPLESGSVKQALHNLHQTAEALTKQAAKMAEGVEKIGLEVGHRIQSIQAAWERRKAEIAKEARAEAQREFQQMLDERKKKSAEAVQKAKAIMEQRADAKKMLDSSDPDTQKKGQALMAEIKPVGEDTAAQFDQWNPGPDYPSGETQENKNLEEASPEDARVPEYRENAQPDASRPMVNVTQAVWNRVQEWVRKFGAEYGIEFDQKDFRAEVSRNLDALRDKSRGRFTFQASSDSGLTLVRNEVAWRLYNYERSQIVRTMESIVRESGVSDRAKTFLERYRSKTLDKELKGFADTPQKRQRWLTQAGRLYYELFLEPGGKTGKLRPDNDADMLRLGETLFPDAPKGGYVLLNLPRSEVERMLEEAGNPEVFGLTDYVPSGDTAAFDQTDPADYFAGLEVPEIGSSDSDDALLGDDSSVDTGIPVSSDDDSDDAVESDDYNEDSGAKEYRAGDKTTTTEGVFDAYAVGRFDSRDEALAAMQEHADAAAPRNNPMGHVAQAAWGGKKQYVIAEDLMARLYPKLYAEFSKPSSKIDAVQPKFDSGGMTLDEAKAAAKAAQAKTNAAKAVRNRWLNLSPNEPIEIAGAKVDRRGEEQRIDDAQHAVDGVAPASRFLDKRYQVIDYDDSHALYMTEYNAANKHVNKNVNTVVDAWRVVHDLFVATGAPYSNGHSLIYYTVDSDGKPIARKYNTVDPRTGEKNLPDIRQLYGATRIDVSQKSGEYIAYSFTIESTQQSEKQAELASWERNPAVLRGELRKAEAIYDGLQKAGGSEYDRARAMRNLCQARINSLEKRYVQILNRNPATEIDPDSPDGRNLQQLAREMQVWGEFKVELDGRLASGKLKGAPEGSIASLVRTPEMEELIYRIRRGLEYIQSRGADPMVSDAVQRKVAELGRQLAQAKLSASAKQGGGALLVEVDGQVEQLDEAIQGLMEQYKTGKAQSSDGDKINAEDLAVYLVSLRSHRNQLAAFAQALRDGGVTEDTPSPIADDMRRQQPVRPTAQSDADLASVDGENQDGQDWDLDDVPSLDDAEQIRPSTADLDTEWTDGEGETETRVPGEATPEASDNGPDLSEPDAFLTALGEIPNLPVAGDQRLEIASPGEADLAKDQLRYLWKATSALTQRIDQLFAAARSAAPEQSQAMNELARRYISVRDQYKKTRNALYDAFSSSRFLGPQEIVRAVRAIENNGHESWKDELSMRAHVERERAGLSGVYERLASRLRDGQLTALTDDDLVHVLIDPDMEVEFSRNRSMYGGLIRRLHEIETDNAALEERLQALEKKRATQSLTDDELKTAGSLMLSLKDGESRLERIRKAADDFRDNSTFRGVQDTLLGKNGGKLPLAVQARLIAIMQEADASAKRNPVASLSRTGLPNYADTAWRVNERFFGRWAPLVNKLLFTPVMKGNADMADHSRALMKRIDESGITRENSSDAQLYAEMQDENEKALLQEQLIEKYGADGFANIERGVAAFREIYDEMLPLINAVEQRNGLPLTERRENYFPHLTELGSTVMSFFGMEYRTDELPSEVIGLTEDFTPRKQFFAHSLERKGDKTENDLLRGMRDYMNVALRIIYQTDNISRLRQFEGYDPKKVLGDEKAEVYSGFRNRRAYADGATPDSISKYVEWLNDYTDSLAGKKVNLGGRLVEKLGDRGVYAFARAMKNTFGASVVVGNLPVALSNLGPIGIVAAKSKHHTLAAMLDVAKTITNGSARDAFDSSSAFLRSRLHGDSINLSAWQDVIEKGTVPFRAIDAYAARVVVRTLYREGRAKGWTHQQALEYADSMALRMMASNQKGEGALIHEDAVGSMFTQFSREGINHLQYLLHDLPREKGGLLAILGTLLFNGLYNLLFNRDTMFDPIGQGVKSWKAQEDGTPLGWKIANVAGDIAQEANPFSRYTDNGWRGIPVVSAATGVWDAGVDGFKSGFSGDWAYDVATPALLNFWPIGGAQIKRVMKGTKDMYRGFTTDGNGNIRYTIDYDQFSVGSAFDWLIATTLGIDTTEAGHAYSYGGGKRLTPTRSEQFKEQTDAGIRSSEAYGNVTGTVAASAAKTEAGKASRLGDRYGAIGAEQEAAQARSGVNVPAGLPGWAYGASAMEELQPVLSVWQATGNSALLPKIIEGKVSVGGRDYDLDDAERAELGEAYKRLYLLAARKAAGSDAAAMEKALASAYKRAVTNYIKDREGGQ